MKPKPKTKPKTKAKPKLEFELPRSVILPNVAVELIPNSHYDDTRLRVSFDTGKQIYSATEIFYGCKYKNKKERQTQYLKIAGEAFQDLLHKYLINQRVDQHIDQHIDQRVNEAMKNEKTTT